ncbi:hypothetical protein AMC90_CH03783 [Rhizobium phaseoli]|uniref:Uncharacterized protein n=1 Tax=Rhizobium phaseoli TaxID=396 RepID=A0ABM6CDZ6_9HYPH|nr:hypothetical protein AMC90_CH03783 [Rhizobium phaseoli]MDH6649395.1 hypothetical protein [Rhizobium esperanzae]ANL42112.1 hypothetical protein AMC88_CH03768 [Rhizobium phaseoli]ANL54822.1 hypothetical protein AMC86_CH03728 [Rhizobium phaseoli]ANL61099.1 hypothetical protein AMC85_CH03766 [Rhizobium phaseoli]
MSAYRSLGRVLDTENWARLDLLQKLLPDSSVYHIKWYDNDSDLDNIRGDRRFQQLLAAAMTQRERIERTAS